MRIFHAHLLSVYWFKPRAKNWGPFTDCTVARPESVCARTEYTKSVCCTKSSCIKQVAHTPIRKCTLFPNNNKIALFYKRRYFSFILSLSWFPFVFSWDLSCFFGRLPCSGVFEGRVVCMCAAGAEEIQLGAYCCLENPLPVMISVLQFNTDAQTRTRTHKHRCWEWWKDGGEGRDGCWREMRRELLSPSTLREERESVRERLLRDRPVKVRGMGEESGDRMIRMAVPSVEKWREWHIERGTTPMWMCKWREKRILRFWRVLWQRKKEWGKTNHGGPVRAYDCRSVGTARALCGQGLCWRAGASPTCLHLTTFVHLYISSALLFPLHGPLLLVRCHYVNS